MSRPTDSDAAAEVAVMADSLRALARALIAELIASGRHADAARVAEAADAALGGLLGLLRVSLSPGGGGR